MIRHLTASPPAPFLRLTSGVIASAVVLGGVAPTNAAPIEAFDANPAVEVAQVAAYNEILGFDLSEAMPKPARSLPRARRRSARRRGARPRR